MTRGQRKFDGKRFCRPCSKWLTLDKVHAGKRGVLYCNECNQKVRTKPRHGKSHAKYLQTVVYH